MGWARRQIGLVGNSVGDLLLPSPCAICEAEDGPLCEDCRVEMVEAAPRQCPRCALSVGPWTDLSGGCSWCRDRSLGFDAAVALGPYQGPIREMCLKMKRVEESWRARWAADVLLDARGEAIRACRPELIVAVPLHWWRRLRRGYNQAEALADQMGRRLGLQVVPGLRRVVATSKLAGIGRTERAKSLRRAFRGGNGHRLKGRTVLLVDDILTTGATCGAAARALKAAGAARVIAAVVGRAEGRT